MELCEKTNSDGVAYYTMRTQWLPKFLWQNYDWIKTVLKPFVEKRSKTGRNFLSMLLLKITSVMRLVCSFLPECFTCKLVLLSMELCGQLTSNKIWNSVMLCLDIKVAVSLFYCKNWNQVKPCKTICHLMLSKFPRIVHLHPFWQSLKSNVNQLI